MPCRRTSQLRNRRRSRPLGRYFITVCTAQRCLGLALLSAPLIEVVRRMDATNDVRTYAFVTMPDHCHWLIELGERLSLAQVVAKFKSLSKRLLCERGLAWQRNYFERGVRADELPEDYALYVFLNPYRAGLLSLKRCWPGWWSGSPESLQFVALLNENGCPRPEWLDLPVPHSLGGRE